MTNQKIIAKLQKKYQNVEVRVLEQSETDDRVDVIGLIYQKNGLPNKPSLGLLEVNKIWDPNGDRPKGFLIFDSFEKEDGVVMSIMVSMDWLDTIPSRKPYLEKWKADFVQ